MIPRIMDLDHSIFKSRPGHVVASAPGKVLVAGGYVVLNGFASLVLTTKARFYAVVGLSDSVPALHIQVESLQFGKTYDYLWHEGAPFVSRLPQTSNNPYVETTLIYAMELLLSLKSSNLALLRTKGLRVTVVADNDFYSQKQTLLEQSLPLGSSSLAKLARFLPLNPNNIAKTGLGSSAALVSSLTSAVLAWGLNARSSDEFSPHLSLVHNLAQLAHCQAQGKIGSGFDVSSAFFGSQLYRRFDAKALSSIMEDAMAAKINEAQLKDQLEQIKAGFGGSVALPPGLVLVLGESGKDMHTPTSVKKVLDWLAANPVVGQKHFESLDSANLAVIDIFRFLHGLHTKDADSYHRARLDASKWSPDVWNTRDVVANPFHKLRQAFQRVRHLLKSLGEFAGTAIEPDEVTRVLDKTMTALPGVLCAGAPGAGGYDAIFAILLDSSNGQRENLEAVWLANDELPICPLLTGEDGHGIEVQLLV